ncbi:hypothetical protein CupriaWKF_03085 [Cupriavidus sp. WKF15]|uniref:hypothetical protein n=1 Tax=Cupriavidus sp. WKF15 TaxID=3032282 RepID=UPI0023E1FB47|nr:hypothetical protein [Cupriavidus sp. WKF15]WER46587.1 hypothetical protein CupriaWKF_03085 [Cupriavidus sp. WKF15]
MYRQDCFRTKSRSSRGRVVASGVPLRWLGATVVCSARREADIRETAALIEAAGGP